MKLLRGLINTVILKYIIEQSLDEPSLKSWKHAAIYKMEVLGMKK
jgi:hypothetical protein